ncbi:uncharacterized protein LOC108696888 isoform X5 [Xenopus laevis]|uniref:Uncharacterized protein LOC108696888 isoform X5 n=1 Tax=Xenopus laevis TaxID=8355 RepID=A0A8J1L886_XENLA|nr:uncharacterized protein LOC108696888 isoform X5 [Xenopus laevis]
MKCRMENPPELYCQPQVRSTMDWFRGAVLISLLLHGVVTHKGDGRERFDLAQEHGEKRQIKGHYSPGPMKMEDGKMQIKGQYSSGPMKMEGGTWTMHGHHSSGPIQMEGGVLPQLQGLKEHIFPEGTAGKMQIKGHYSSGPMKMEGEWTKGAGKPEGAVEYVIGETAVGTQFITAFLQNHDIKESAKLEVLVTATSSPTSVTVIINNSDFQKELTVGKGETVTIPLPETIEMKGKDVLADSVIIQSDNEVTVVSRNLKYASGDTALIYPVDRLGTEYYIFTPPFDASSSYKEFAVIAYGNETKVDIYLNGAVNFKGKDYEKGSKLTLSLQPFQTVQLQSTDDLSGSRVVSEYPVAVLSGHTCSKKNGDCDHVYEQLLPVSSWGSTFYIPGLSFQPKSDIVFVIASQDTAVDFQSGTNKGKKTLRAGEVIQFEVAQNSPLTLNANHKIQVFFYGTGGKFQDNIFGVFLSSVPATTSFGLEYEIIGQDNMEVNLAVIITKTLSLEAITFDGKPLTGIKWQEFPGSKFSWAEYNYGSGLSSHVVAHPTDIFGLLSIGYSKSTAYGSVAASIRGPGFGEMSWLQEYMLQPGAQGQPMGPQMAPGFPMPGMSGQWIIMQGQGPPTEQTVYEGTPIVQLPGTTDEWIVELDLPSGPAKFTGKPIAPVPGKKGKWTIEAHHPVQLKTEHIMQPAEPAPGFPMPGMTGHWIIMQGQGPPTEQTVYEGTPIAQLPGTTDEWIVELDLPSGPAKFTGKPIAPVPGKKGKWTIEAHHPVQLKTEHIMQPAEPAPDFPMPGMTGHWIIMQGQGPPTEQTVYEGTPIAQLPGTTDEWIVELDLPSGPAKYTGKPIAPVPGKKGKWTIEAHHPVQLKTEHIMQPAEPAPGFPMTGMTGHWIIMQGQGPPTDQTVYEGTPITQLPGTTDEWIVELDLPSGPAKYTGKPIAPVPGKKGKWTIEAHHPVQLKTEHIMQPAEPAPSFPTTGMTGQWIIMQGQGPPTEKTVYEGTPIVQLPGTTDEWIVELDLPSGPAKFTGKPIAPVPGKKGKWTIEAHHPVQLKTEHIMQPAEPAPGFAMPGMTGQWIIMQGQGPPSEQTVYEGTPIAQLPGTTDEWIVELDLPSGPVKYTGKPIAPVPGKKGKWTIEAHHPVQLRPGTYIGGTPHVLMTNEEVPLGPESMTEGEVYMEEPEEAEQPAEIQFEWGPSDVTSHGKDFATVFLQNHKPDEKSKLELFVTSKYASTSVSVTISNSDFRKELRLKKGETVTVPISAKMEMQGSKAFPNVVVIKANKDVTVISRNSKYASIDTALIYPLHRLGNEYYIITPPWGPATSLKEFALVSLGTPTTINIDLNGAIHFQDRDYPRGSRLTIHLNPFQAVQFQSTDDLSGTKITSQSPIAVLSGHTCSAKNGECDHVYEQLLPVTNWGRTFFIPGMSFQSKTDIVFVGTYQDTVIDYQSGPNREKKNVGAGEVIQFETSQVSPLSLNANNNIQVFYFGTGGISGKSKFGTFLTNIPSTESFGLEYEVIAQDKFKVNLAIIICKTSSQGEFTTDGNSMENIEWKAFPGLEYSWGELNYGSGFSSHKIQHPTTPFGLLSIGYSPSTAYGSVAPCIRGPAVVAPGEWIIERRPGQPTRFRGKPISEIPGRKGFWIIEVTLPTGPRKYVGRPIFSIPGTTEWIIETEEPTEPVPYEEQPEPFVSGGWIIEAFRPGQKTKFRGRPKAPIFGRKGIWIIEVDLPTGKRLFEGRPLSPFPGTEGEWIVETEEPTNPVEYKETPGAPATTDWIIALGRPGEPTKFKGRPVAPIPGTKGKWLIRVVMPFGVMEYEGKPVAPLPDSDDWIIETEESTAPVPYEKKPGVEVPTDWILTMGHPGQPTRFKGRPIAPIKGKKGYWLIKVVFPSGTMEYEGRPVAPLPGTDDWIIETGESTAPVPYEEKPDMPVSADWIIELGSSGQPTKFKGKPVAPVPNKKGIWIISVSGNILYEGKPIAPLPGLEGDWLVETEESTTPVPYDEQPGVPVSTDWIIEIGSPGKPTIFKARPLVPLPGRKGIWIVEVKLPTETLQFEGKPKAPIPGTDGDWMVETDKPTMPIPYKQKPGESLPKGDWIIELGRPDHPGKFKGIPIGPIPGTKGLWLIKVLLETGPEYYQGRPVGPMPGTDDQWIIETEEPSAPVPFEETPGVEIPKDWIIQLGGPGRPTTFKGRPEAPVPDKKGIWIIKVELPGTGTVTYEGIPKHPLPDSDDWIVETEESSVPVPYEEKPEAPLFKDWIIQMGRQGQPTKFRGKPDAPVPGKKGVWVMNVRFPTETKQYEGIPRTPLESIEGEWIAETEEPTVPIPYEEKPEAPLSRDWIFEIGQPGKPTKFKGRPIAPILEKKGVWIIEVKLPTGTVWYEGIPSAPLTEGEWIVETEESTMPVLYEEKPEAPVFTDWLIEIGAPDKPSRFKGKPVAPVPGKKGYWIIEVKMPTGKVRYEGKPVSQLPGTEGDWVVETEEPTVPVLYEENPEAPVSTDFIIEIGGSGKPTKFKGRPVAPIPGRKGIYTIEVKLPTGTELYEGKPISPIPGTDGDWTIETEHPTMPVPYESKPEEPVSKAKWIIEFGSPGKPTKYIGKPKAPVPGRKGYWIIQVTQPTGVEEYIGRPVATLPGTDGDWIVETDESTIPEPYEEKPGTEAPRDWIIEIGQPGKPTRFKGRPIAPVPGKEGKWIIRVFTPTGTIDYEGKPLAPLPDSDDWIIETDDSSLPVLYEENPEAPAPTDWIIDPAHQGQPSKFKGRPIAPFPGKPGMWIISVRFPTGTKYYIGRPRSPLTGPEGDWIVETEESTMPLPYVETPEAPVSTDWIIEMGSPGKPTKFKGKPIAPAPGRKEMWILEVKQPTGTVRYLGLPKSPLPDGDWLAETEEPTVPVPYEEKPEAPVTTDWIIEIARPGLPTKFKAKPVVPITGRKGIWIVEVRQPTGTVLYEGRPVSPSPDKEGEWITETEPSTLPVPYEEKPGEPLPKGEWLIELGSPGKPTKFRGKPVAPIPTKKGYWLIKVTTVRGVEYYEGKPITAMPGTDGDWIVETEESTVPITYEEKPGSEVPKDWIIEIGAPGQPTKFRGRPVAPHPEKKDAWIINVVVPTGTMQFEGKPVSPFPGSDDDWIIETLEPTVPIPYEEQPGVVVFKDFILQMGHSGQPSRFKGKPFAPVIGKKGIWIISVQFPTGTRLFEGRPISPLTDPEGNWVVETEEATAPVPYEEKPEAPVSTDWIIQIGGPGQPSKFKGTPIAPIPNRKGEWVVEVKLPTGTVLYEGKPVAPMPSAEGAWTIETAQPSMPVQYEEKPGEPIPKGAWIMELARPGQPTKFIGRPVAPVPNKKGIWIIKVQQPTGVEEYEGKPIAQMPGTDGDWIIETDQPTVPVPYEVEPGAPSPSGDWVIEFTHDGQPTTFKGKPIGPIPGKKGYWTIQVTLPTGTMDYEGIPRSPIPGTDDWIVETGKPMVPIPYEGEPGVTIPTDWIIQLASPGQPTKFKGIPIAPIPGRKAWVVEVKLPKETMELEGKPIAPLPETDGEWLIETEQPTVPVPYETKPGEPVPKGEWIVEKAQPNKPTKFKGRPIAPIYGKQGLWLIRVTLPTGTIEMEGRPVSAIPGTDDWIIETDQLTLPMPHEREPGAQIYTDWIIEIGQSGQPTKFKGTPIARVPGKKDIWIVNVKTPSGILQFEGKPLAPLPGTEREWTIETEQPTVPVPYEGKPDEPLFKDWIVELASEDKPTKFKGKLFAPIPGKKDKWIIKVTSPTGIEEYEGKPIGPISGTPEWIIETLQPSVPVPYVQTPEAPVPTGDWITEYTFEDKPTKFRGRPMAPIPGKKGIWIIEVNLPTEKVYYEGIPITPIAQTNGEWVVETQKPTLPVPYEGEPGVPVTTDWITELASPGKPTRFKGKPIAPISGRKRTWLIRVTQPTGVYEYEGIPESPIPGTDDWTIKTEEPTAPVLYEAKPEEPSPKEDWIIELGSADNPTKFKGRPSAPIPQRKVWVIKVTRPTGVEEFEGIPISEIPGGAGEWIIKTEQPTTPVPYEQEPGAPSPTAEWIIDMTHEDQPTKFKAKPVAPYPGRKGLWIVDVKIPTGVIQYYGIPKFPLADTDGEWLTETEKPTLPFPYEPEAGVQLQTDWIIEIGRPGQPTKFKGRPKAPIPGRKGIWIIDVETPSGTIEYEGKPVSQVPGVDGLWTIETELPSMPVPYEGKPGEPVPKGEWIIELGRPGQPTKFKGIPVAPIPGNKGKWLIKVPLPTGTEEYEGIPIGPIPGGDGHWIIATEQTTVPVPYEQKPEAPVPSGDWIIEMTNGDKPTKFKGRPQAPIPGRKGYWIIEVKMPSGNVLYEGIPKAPIPDSDGQWVTETEQPTLPVPYQGEPGVETKTDWIINIGSPDQPTRFKGRPKFPIPGRKGYWIIEVSTPTGTMEYEGKPVSPFPGIDGEWTVETDEGTMPMPYEGKPEEPKVNWIINFASPGKPTTFRGRPIAPIPGRKGIWIIRLITPNGIEEYEGIPNSPVPGSDGDWVVQTEESTAPIPYEPKPEAPTPTGDWIIEFSHDDKPTKFKGKPLAPIPGRKGFWIISVPQPSGTEEYEGKPIAPLPGTDGYWVIETEKPTLPVPYQREPGVSITIDWILEMGSPGHPTTFKGKPLAPVPGKKGYWIIEVKFPTGTKRFIGKPVAPIPGTDGEWTIETAQPTMPEEYEEEPGVPTPTGDWIIEKGDANKPTKFKGKPQAPIPGKKGFWIIRVTLPTGVEEYEGRPVGQIPGTDDWIVETEKPTMPAPYEEKPGEPTISDLSNWIIETSHQDQPTRFKGKPKAPVPNRKGLWIITVMLPTGAVEYIGIPKAPIPGTDGDWIIETDKPTLPELYEPEPGIPTPTGDWLILLGTPGQPTQFKGRPKVPIPGKRGKWIVDVITPSGKDEFEGKPIAPISGTDGDWTIESEPSSIPVPYEETPENPLPKGEWITELATPDHPTAFVGKPVAPHPTKKGLWIIRVPQPTGTEEYEGKPISPLAGTEGDWAIETEQPTVPVPYEPKPGDPVPTGDWIIELAHDDQPTKFKGRPNAPIPNKKEMWLIHVRTPSGILEFEGRPMDPLAGTDGDWMIETDQPTLPIPYEKEPGAPSPSGEWIIEFAQPGQKTKFRAKPLVPLYGRKGIWIVEVKLPTETRNYEGKPISPTGIDGEWITETEHTSVPIEYEGKKEEPLPIVEWIQQLARPGQPTQFKGKPVAPIPGRKGVYIIRVTEPLGTEDYYGIPKAPLPGTEGEWTAETEQPTVPVPYEPEPGAPKPTGDFIMEMAQPDKPTKFKGRPVAPIPNRKGIWIISVQTPTGTVNYEGRPISLIEETDGDWIVETEKPTLPVEYEPEPGAPTPTGEFIIEVSRNRQPSKFKGRPSAPIPGSNGLWIIDVKFPTGTIQYVGKPRSPLPGTEGDWIVETEGPTMPLPYEEKPEAPVPQGGWILQLATLDKPTKFKGKPVAPIIGRKGIWIIQVQQPTGIEEYEGKPQAPIPGTDGLWTIETEQPTVPVQYERKPDTPAPSGAWILEFAHDDQPTKFKGIPVAPIPGRKVWIIRVTLPSGTYEFEGVPVAQFPGTDGDWIVETEQPTLPVPYEEEPGVTRPSAEWIIELGRSGQPSRFKGKPVSPIPGRIGKWIIEVRTPTQITLYEGIPTAPIPDTDDWTIETEGPTVPVLYQGKPGEPVPEVKWIIQLGHPGQPTRFKGRPIAPIPGKRGKWLIRVTLPTGIEEYEGKPVSPITETDDWIIETEPSTVPVPYKPETEVPAPSGNFIIELTKGDKPTKFKGKPIAPGNTKGKWIIRVTTPTGIEYYEGRPISAIPGTEGEWIIETEFPTLPVPYEEEPGAKLPTDWIIEFGLPGQPTKFKGKPVAPIPGRRGIWIFDVIFPTGVVQYEGRPKYPMADTDDWIIETEMPTIPVQYEPKPGEPVPKGEWIIEKAQSNKPTKFRGKPVAPIPGRDGMWIIKITLPTGVEYYEGKPLSLIPETDGEWIVQTEQPSLPVPYDVAPGVQMPTGGWIIEMTNGNKPTKFTGIPVAPVSGRKGIWIIKVILTIGTLVFEGKIISPLAGTEEWIIETEQPTLPVLYVGGPYDVTSLGKEFVTAFLQNHNPHEKPRLELFITGTAPDTTVSVSVSQTDFLKTQKVGKDETISIPITEPVEMQGTGTSPRSIVIKSDAEITIVSSNFKYASADTALLYPVHRLGRVYFVFTPPFGPGSAFKEFAVVSYDKATTVDIDVMGAINFDGKDYPKGSRLTLSLEPFQAVQFQSPDDLTGTKVVSQHPIALLSGHTCSKKYGDCDHVYEQLLPVPSWGSTFYIPGLSFQTKSDFVFVVASEDTTIDYQTGKEKGKKNLAAGESAQFEVTQNSPLSLDASRNIQVFLYGAGGTSKDKLFGTFLTSLTAITLFGSGYQIIGQERFETNLAVFIIKTSSRGQLSFDRKPLPGLNWKSFPGSEYSWAEYDYGRSFGSHLVEHPSSSFGLLSIGYSPSTSYASLAPIIRGPAVPLPKAKDECSDVNCRIEETCKIKDGQGICEPNYVGTCWGWGDPHYSTFDGKKFDFQGTCSYILTQYLGNENGLQPFSIKEKNENRGNKAVSFVRHVTIEVYGHEITIKKGESPQIRVDGILQNLPVTLEGGKIKIIRSGKTALLITDFDLRASYDWDWHVIVKLPSSYHGLTSGLCGNLNKDPADDMFTEDNIPATSITEWAKSYKINDKDPFCSDACIGQCPSCDENLKNQYRGDKSCGMITDSNGPFKECQAKIDSENFYSSCIYDVCMNGGAKVFLCQALNAYATECKRDNINIAKWRTAAGCPLDCPANSHYEACATACPASCADRTAPSTCKEPCVETCQCNEGFILSSDQCVPSTSCGCNYKGLYYQANEEYWADDSCSSYCRCDPQSGEVVCQDRRCKAGEVCKVVNGKRGCHPSGFSTCIASGDPHYTTFDGRKFDYMGTCIYQMVKVTSADSTLTPFSVTVQNNNRGKKTVSFTKVVTFEVYGQNIVVDKDKPREIQVNGIQTQLPYYYENDKIVAYISGIHVFMKTDFEVTVTFDWNSYARVILPQNYANAVSGLCGNSNKDPSDDFTMSNGAKAKSEKEFGDSWKVADVPGCDQGCATNCPKCKEENKAKYKSDQYCGIITKADGPFKNCHATVNPTSYFDDCVFDTCYFEGQSVALTSAVSNYVSACQAEGLMVLEWRAGFFTKLSCPSNSHYEICGTGCAATCHGLSSPKNCKASCSEGCYCDSGYILSGGNCIPITECGSYYKGKYYKKGERFYADDTCTEYCTVRKNGEVSCEILPCAPTDTCEVVNGIRSCRAQTCAKCSLAGAHISTFDGKNYDFQGTCAYTVAKTNPGDPRLEPFSVTVQNQFHNQTNLVVLKSITLSIYGYDITLVRGQRFKVLINGEVKQLPVFCPCGRGFVNKEGHYIVIQTESQVKVIYDTQHKAIVQIPGGYANNMQALCGNYNDDVTDEFRLPDGTLVTNVDVFGASWKVPGDDPTCQDGCGANCPTLNAMKVAEYSKETKCGLIKATNGPFKGCFSRVNPKHYFKGCVEDMNILDDDSVLCMNIQGFAAACQAAGAEIKPWRTDKFCPLLCKNRSSYDLCTRTCDQNCASLTVPNTCTKRCFEGCKCAEGEFFNGDECVPMEKCGCVNEGTYFKVGESIMTENCSNKCSCNAGGGVSCDATSCTGEQTCSVRNKERGCYARNSIIMK